ncbi:MAG: endolytic transglycosylase MltG, partial [Bacteroidia bacterium]|nr:endolytic transglycosylase MltG [Bacteroidia bacterium]
IETIDAVLDAPKTDYLYFVATSNLDGSSVFTTNYRDHIKYAHQYQKALDSLSRQSKKN